MLSVDQIHELLLLKGADILNAIPVTTKMGDHPLGGDGELTVEEERIGLLKLARDSKHGLWFSNKFASDKRTFLLCVRCVATVVEPPRQLRTVRIATSVEIDPTVESFERTVQKVWAHQGGELRKLHDSERCFTLQLLPVEDAIFDLLASPFGSQRANAFYDG